MLDPCDAAVADYCQSLAGLDSAGLRVGATELVRRRVLLLAASIAVQPTGEATGGFSDHGSKRPSPIAPARPTSIDAMCMALQGLVVQDHLRAALLASMALHAADTPLKTEQDLMTPFDAPSYPENKNSNEASSLSALRSESLLEVPLASWRELDGLARLVGAARSAGVQGPLVEVVEDAGQSAAPVLAAADRYAMHRLGMVTRCSVVTSGHDVPLVLSARPVGLDVPALPDRVSAWRGRRSTAVRDRALARGGQGWHRSSRSPSARSDSGSRSLLRQGSDRSLGDLSEDEFAQGDHAETRSARTSEVGENGSLRQNALDPEYMRDAGLGGQRRTRMARAGSSTISGSTSIRGRVTDGITKAALSSCSNRGPTAWHHSGQIEEEDDPFSWLGRGTWAGRLSARHVALSMAALRPATASDLERVVLRRERASELAAACQRLEDSAGDRAEQSVAMREIRRQQKTWRLDGQLGRAADARSPFDRSPSVAAAAFVGAVADAGGKAALLEAHAPRRLFWFASAADGYGTGGRGDRTTRSGSRSRQQQQQHQQAAPTWNAIESCCPVAFMWAAAGILAAIAALQRVLLVLLDLCDRLCMVASECKLSLLRTMGYTPQLRTRSSAANGVHGSAREDRGSGGPSPAMADGGLDTGTRTGGSRVDGSGSPAAPVPNARMGPNQSRIQRQGLPRDVVALGPPAGTVRGRELALDAIGSDGRRVLGRIGRTHTQHHRAPAQRLLRRLGRLWSELGLVFGALCLEWRSRIDVLVAAAHAGLVCDCEGLVIRPSALSVDRAAAGDAASANSRRGHAYPMARGMGRQAQRQDSRYDHGHATSAIPLAQDQEQSWSHMARQWFAGEEWRVHQLLRLLRATEEHTFGTASVSDDPGVRSGETLTTGITSAFGPQLASSSGGWGRGMQASVRLLQSALGSICRRAEGVGSRRFVGHARGGLELPISVGGIAHPEQSAWTLPVQRRSPVTQPFKRQNLVPASNYASIPGSDQEWTRAGSGDAAQSPWLKPTVAPFADGQEVREAKSRVAVEAATDAAIRRLRWHRIVLAHCCCGGPCIPLCTEPCCGLRARVRGRGQWRRLVEASSDTPLSSLLASALPEPNATIRGRTQTGGGSRQTGPASASISASDQVDPRGCTVPALCGQHVRTQCLRARAERAALTAEAVDGCLRRSAAASLRSRGSAMSIAPSCIRVIAQGAVAAVWSFFAAIGIALSLWVHGGRKEPVNHLGQRRASVRGSEVGPEQPDAACSPQGGLCSPAGSAAALHASVGLFSACGGHSEASADHTDPHVPRFDVSSGTQTEDVRISMLRAACVGGRLSLPLWLRRAGDSTGWEDESLLEAAATRLSRSCWVAPFGLISPELLTAPQRPSSSTLAPVPASTAGSILDRSVGGSEQGAGLFAHSDEAQWARLAFAMDADTDAGGPGTASRSIYHDSTGTAGAPAPRDTGSSTVRPYGGSAGLLGCIPLSVCSPATRSSFGSIALPLQSGNVLKAELAVREPQPQPRVQPEADKHHQEHGSSLADRLAETKRAQSCKLSDRIDEEPWIQQDVDGAVVPSASFPSRPAMLMQCAPSPDHGAAAASSPYSTARALAQLRLSVRGVLITSPRGPMELIRVVDHVARIGRASSCKEQRRGGVSSQGLQSLVPQAALVRVAIGGFEGMRSQLLLDAAACCVAPGGFLVVHGCQPESLPRPRPGRGRDDDREHDRAGVLVTGGSTRSREPAVVRLREASRRAATMRRRMGEAATARASARIGSPVHGKWAGPVPLTRHSGALVWRAPQPQL